MTTLQRVTFIAAIEQLAGTLHENSKKHGFWDMGVENRNKGEMIALMHSELSEALEGIRKPCPDKHCPNFTSESIELADTIIRILEYCAAFKIPIAEAILVKHDYNMTRPYKHGKAF